MLSRGKLRSDKLFIFGEALSECSIVLPQMSRSEFFSFFWKGGKRVEETVDEGGEMWRASSDSAGPNDKP